MKTPARTTYMLELQHTDTDWGYCILECIGGIPRYEHANRSWPKSEMDQEVAEISGKAALEFYRNLRPNGPLVVVPFSNIEKRMLMVGIMDNFGTVEIGGTINEYAFEVMLLCIQANAAYHYHTILTGTDADKYRAALDLTTLVGF